jgi:hypothetical protein
MSRPLAALALILCTAAPAAADKRSSCFDGPPLVAGNVWSHLSSFSASQNFWDGESPLPKTTYGRCEVREATLFDPRGRRLARLHCGIVVERSGLIGPLGLEVGAFGKRVIERTRPEKDQRLVCTAYTGGSRCGYYDKSGADPPSTYIVKRRLRDGVRLEGAAAERFFRGQRIDKIFVTIGCH